MTWDVSADPLDFEEAIAWFRDRVPLTRDEWDELTARAREKAFTVAGVAQLDLVAEVKAAVDRAVKEGTDLREFKRAVQAKLEAAWGGTVSDIPWRLETIFRTNLQFAYAAGRHKQATDPAVIAVRPFWLYDAILDGRTTTHCRAWDGKVLPADHPAWAAHYPPAHFNCRATVTTLTEEQARRLGVTRAPPSVPSASGFGSPPDVGTPWKPRKQDYPDAFWEKYEKKKVEARVVRPAQAGKRIAIGEHVLSVKRGENVPVAAVKALFDATPALTKKVLEKFPLRDLSLERFLEDEPDANGVYYMLGGNRMRIRMKRHPLTFGRQREGRSWSISERAADEAAARARTFTHETGHHLRDSTPAARDIIRAAYRKALQADRAVTEYALRNAEEYFAESYAAYVFERELLAQADPAAVTMVEEVLALAGVNDDGA